MRSNVFNISRTAANLGFLTLFPGFLLYHYAVAQSWIPPFLGGLFGSVEALLAVVALVLIPWIASEGLAGAVTPAAVVGVTMAYIALWSVVNYLFLQGETFAGIALWEAFSALAGWLAMLLVGACYPFDEPLPRRALAVAAVLMVLAFVHAMIRFRSPLGPYLTFSLGDDQDAGVASYQGIGRSVVVSAIVLAAGARTTRGRLLLLTGTSFLLVLLGSRTDLFTVLALIAAVVGLTMLRGNLAAIVAVVVGAYVLYVVAGPIFLETRNAEIFDLASSTSWQARHDLEVRALGVIRDHPLLGDFGYHHRIGGTGYYAHNALSAWTNYGMLGFALYLGLIVYFLLASIRRVIATDVRDSAWLAAMLLNLAALIQAALATPVFTPLPALGWGIALNAMRAQTGTGERRDDLAPATV